MDPDAEDCMTAMSCNHYPSWEGKAYQEGTLRRIAHTDFEILTLLFNRKGLLLATYVCCTDSRFCCTVFVVTAIATLAFDLDTLQWCSWTIAA